VTLRHPRAGRLAACGRRESWTDRGEVAQALAAFEGWHPQVRAIIGAVDETYVWARSTGPRGSASATR
jgi:hypothetical protein